jgi:hypothetical protein
LSSEKLLLVFNLLPVSCLSVERFLGCANRGVAHNTVSFLFLKSRVLISIPYMVVDDNQIGGDPRSALIDPSDLYDSDIL